MTEWPGKFGQVCEHGNLRRSCDVCRLQWELGELEKVRARLESELAQAQERIADLETLLILKKKSDGKAP